MGSEARWEDPVRRPPEEGPSPEIEDAGAGVTEDASAPHSRYQYQTPTAEDLRRVLDAAQRGDLLFSCSLAWKLGNELIDQRSYEQSADCLRRMLRAAKDLDDEFLIELAMVAEQLCTAIGGEQPPGKDLLLAHERLRQSLFVVADEDLDFAKGVLDGRAEARPSTAREPSPILPVDPSVKRPVTEDASPSTDAWSQDHRGPRVDRHEPPAGASVPAHLHLRVLLLGHFEVLHHGKALSFGRNSRASAIFKYLVADRSQLVSQDLLMEWLWPKSDLKRARWSLNSAIYALRRALSNELPTSTSEHILLENGYYRLSPHIRVSSDVEEFDALHERGRLLEKAQRASEAAAEYEKAIELYRGDYRAEELYEDWTTIERERLANAYVDMMDRLASYYMENGQLRKSIQCCYLLLKRECCHENSYRLLMRCYARLGLRIQALRQYLLCEQMLRHQYGITPAPETQSLYKSLLKGESI